MQEQYQRLKAEAGDAFLFFRLGDFYELFGEDAERAAPVLEVVLTSREVSPGLRTPMCGIPHHALTGYLRRMLARGHRVAIADQVEEPAQARGLVRREITRLVSPGTAADPDLLEPGAERLLVAAAPGALAVADVSTGTLRVARLPPEGEDPEAGAAEAELHRLGPREIVAPDGAVPDWARRYAEAAGVPVTLRAAAEFDPEDGPRTFPGGPADAALGGLLAYLRHSLRGDLAGLRAPEVYAPSAHLALDPAAQRNLELVLRLQDGGSAGTLLAVLDRTATAMGRRLLRFWLLHPLQEPEAIAARLEAVEELVRRPLFREGLREPLRHVSDLERLAARTIAQRASPRELLALGLSLRALPEALAALQGCGAALIRAQVAAVDPQGEVAELLLRALSPDAPAQVRDGGIFAPGWDAALDETRAAARDGREWVARLEAQERQRTGIRGLRVGFNRVFGYYIEVGAAHAAAVPPEYVRRQTTSSAERYVTPALKDLEERILGAEGRALRREQALFAELRASVAARGAALQATASAVACLDVLASLAAVAVHGGWVRPRVDRSGDLVIRGGRHPVLEAQLGPGRFVPNDTVLSRRGERFLLLSGPNMAGKSTYMRQVALIAVLAHAGSFVPAEEARMGVVDRIFTRVGASDDLAGGRSTFMVEMAEVVDCLRHATARSLLLLDEVGRGTGTLDGLAIAWAVAEDLATRLGARTLFSTHYHELTSVVAALPGAGNAHAAVREQPGGVVFLHRVVPGPTDRSYGLAVASLAGMPAPVLDRASALLRDLQKSGGVVRSVAEAGGDPAAEAPPALPPAAAALLSRLAAVDPLRLTPLQALDLLAVLQAEASGLSAEAGAGRS